MKRNHVLAAVIIALTLFTYSGLFNFALPQTVSGQPSPDGNYVVNPSFESGDLTGWSGGGTNVIADPSQPWSGAYSARLTGSGGQVEIGQAISGCFITSNTILFGALRATQCPSVSRGTYLCVCIVGVSGGGSGTQYFNYYLGSGLWDGYDSKFFSQGNSPNVWFEVCRNITADVLSKGLALAPGAAVVGVYFGTRVGAGQYAWGDNFYLGNDILVTRGSNPWYNNEFEDPRWQGTAPYEYPVGWSGGWGTSAGTSEFVPGYLHYWSVKLTANAVPNAQKNFFTYLANPPRYVSFAFQLSAVSANDIAELNIYDTNAVKYLIYEFGMSTEAKQSSDDTYVKVIHEKVGSLWEFKTKDWQSDWRTQWGSDPTLSDTWRFTLAVKNLDGAYTFSARFDAFWIGDTLTPNYNIFKYSEQVNPYRYSGNYVFNPFFESGDLTGWSGGGTNVIADPSQPSSGAYSARITGSGGQVEIGQSFPLVCPVTSKTVLLGALKSASLPQFVRATYVCLLVQGLSGGAYSSQWFNYYLGSGLWDGQDSKFFSLGNIPNQWYRFARNITADILSKGLGVGPNAQITNIYFGIQGLVTGEYAWGDGFYLGNGGNMATCESMLQDVNLIANGEFEDTALTSWTVTQGTVGTDSLQSWNGMQSARCDGNSNGRSEIGQLLPFACPVTSNKILLGALKSTSVPQVVRAAYICLYIKGLTGGAYSSQWFNYYLGSGLWDSQDSKFFSLGNIPNQWYRFARNITADILSKGLGVGPNTVATNIYFGVYLGPGQSAWCDDLFLGSIGSDQSVLGGVNLIANGEFEEAGFAPWTVIQGTGASLSSQSWSGLQSVCCLGTADGRSEIGQALPLVCAVTSKTVLLGSLRSTSLPQLVRAAYICLYVQGLTGASYSSQWFNYYLGSGLLDGQDSKFFSMGNIPDQWYRFARNITADILSKGLGVGPNTIITNIYFGAYIGPGQCAWGDDFYLGYDNLHLPIGVGSVNIYVLDISTSLHHFVTSGYNVYRGVLDAVANATTCTPVKLAGEVIRVSYVTSERDLAYLAEHPSEFAQCVFVNTHGEVLPIPSGYGSDWGGWIDKIAENCRRYGWIWVNVAGYPFYYYSNTHSWGSLQTIDPVGLRQYLGKDITLNSYDMASSCREFQFRGKGFEDTFNKVPDNVCAGWAAAKLALPWESIGYFMPDGDDSRLTFATPMIETVMGLETIAGMFVQSGLADDASGNGNPVYNDWLKGYVATAMSIEESRKLIQQPSMVTQIYGWHEKAIDGSLIWHPMPPHTAVFMISMDPYTCSMHYESYGDFVEVDLKFAIGAQFDGYTKPDWVTASWSLGVNDVDLSSSDSSLRFVVNNDSLGLDTGIYQDRTLMDNMMFWWTVGALAGMIPGVGVILGPAVGLIPILIHDPSHPPTTIRSNSPYRDCVNGTSIDPNNDQKGTTCCIVKLRLYGDKVLGSDSHVTFTARMFSSIALYEDFYGLVNERWAGISYTTQLSLVVHNWSR